MRFTLGFLIAAAVVIASPFPAGVTSAVSPAGSKPSGCALNRAASFGLAVEKIDGTDASLLGRAATTVIPASIISDGQIQAPVTTTISSASSSLASPSSPTEASSAQASSAQSSFESSAQTSSAQSSARFSTHTSFTHASSAQASSAQASSAQASSAQASSAQASSAQASSAHASSAQTSAQTSSAQPSSAKSSSTSKDETVTITNTVNVICSSSIVSASATSVYCSTITLPQGGESTLAPSMATSSSYQFTPTQVTAVSQISDGQVQAPISPTTFVTIASANPGFAVRDDQIQTDTLTWRLFPTISLAVEPTPVAHWSISTDFAKRALVSLRNLLSTDENMGPGYLPTAEVSVNLSTSDPAACKTHSALMVSLHDGVLKDNRGRTGYIASNRQFQFDAPPQSKAIYTAGFSACDDGNLALGNSTVFWQCLSGNFYNLYDQNWAAQCEPVRLQLVTLEDC